LLIDDAPELVQVIVERSEEAGFRMVTADTGRRAIDLVLNQAAFFEVAGTSTAGTDAGASTTGSLGGATRWGSRGQP
jgi:CheY-like chemotaxis protein